MVKAFVLGMLLLVLLLVRFSRTPPYILIRALHLAL
jgi:hypothetical protein